MIFIGHLVSTKLFSHCYFIVTTLSTVHELIFSVFSIPDSMMHLLVSFYERQSKDVKDSITRKRVTPFAQVVKS